MLLVLVFAKDAQLNVELLVKLDAGKDAQAVAVEVAQLDAVEAVRTTAEMHVATLVVQVVLAVA